MKPGPLEGTALLLLFTLGFFVQTRGEEYTSNQQTTARSSSNCNIYKEIGVNDLAINDIVVRSAQGTTACIKAKFRLAIKVEATIDEEGNEQSSTVDPTVNQQHGDNYSSKNPPPTTDEHNGKQVVLGYLPLDSVISIDDNCPEAKPAPVSEKNRLLEEPKELDMNILFECGRLTFRFKQDPNHIYLSAIKGSVNLDSINAREFVSEQPMFLTSDLAHHFKFDELVEVHTTQKPKAFVLTANFYHLELEAFRNTSSRNFIRPPDLNARAFPV